MKALDDVRLSSLVSNSTLGNDPSLYGWISDCHGFWHDFVLIVASALFVAYFAFQTKKTYTKLSHCRSYIIIAYYSVLGIVSVLNFVWCALQAWECNPRKEVAWNILSLFTTSSMLFLEVSLMAFILQGNNASGLEALTHTFAVSGLIVGLDMLLKVIYVFGFGIPLFIKTVDGTHHRLKWGLWIFHKLLLTAVYGFIFFMYRSRWRERLPARPSFYNYITVMFVLNAITLFACGLTAHGAGFGFWLYEATVTCYHAFYLPLLYATFLRDFLQVEDLLLENVYYSEMKDAGFFDAGWDDHPIST